MQPIYLPFTHISCQIAGRIHELLGKFIIYQPGGLPIPSRLIDLETKGILEIRKPVKIPDQDRLADLSRDYHAWANLSGRKKIDTRAFIAASDQIPFFDQHSSNRIRTEINKLRRGESIKSRPDLVLTARLFLALAQEYDTHKMDLAKDFNAVAIMEKQMLDHLAADPNREMNSSYVKPLVVEDVGGYMTKQRLEAWSTLFGLDSRSGNVFVTDSRAVIDQLLDISDDLILLATSQDLTSDPQPADITKPTGNDIQVKLRQLGETTDPLGLTQKWSQKKPSTDKIQYNSDSCLIYGAPGISPDKFWQRYEDRTDGKKNNADKNPEMLNTLVFYLKQL